MTALRNAWIHYSYEQLVLDCYDGISFQRKPTEQYGVLCIQTENVPLTRDPILFHFQVDVSGSMSDITSDGRTKMQLIIHTLTNMLHYFAEKCENGYVQVTGFDDKIHPYIAPVHVTSENVNELVAILAKMRPMEFTDIGMAIQQLCKDIEEDVLNIPRQKHVGILLTDGEPTMGIQNPKDLAALVPTDISMNFIALGDEHSGDVMHALGHVSPLSSNWFVDKLEHTGNVYGEIIFNELNRVSEATELRIKNGRIYDYTCGKFVEHLHIGILSAETCKFYHILTDDPNCCEVDITGNSSTGDHYCWTASDMPPLIPQEDVDKPFSTDDVLFVEKQWVRMHVQILMSNARNIQLDANPIPRPILKRMTLGVQHRVNIPSIFEGNHASTDTDTNNLNRSMQLRKEIELMTKYLGEFIATHQLGDDPMMNGLRDDLLILEKTFGTGQFIKYAGIREDSQGRQYTCNTITEIPSDILPIFGGLNRPCLTRTPTSAYSTPGRVQLMNSFSQNNTQEDEDKSMGQMDSSASMLELLSQYSR